MQFNILLEGCDCVGKTSIYEEIMHRGILGESMIGIKYFAVPPKNKTESEKIHNKILKISNKFHGLVFDRHMLSEKIYAPILRKYKTNYIDYLESQLSTHNILFLITTDFFTIRKRFEKEKLIPINLIPLILGTYLREFYLSKHYFHKFVINTTKMTPYQALQAIEMKILDIEKISYNTDKKSKN